MYLTDEAAFQPIRDEPVSNTVPGPFLPVTNAPRRGGTVSPQFSTPATWAVRWDGHHPSNGITGTVAVMANWGEAGVDGLGGRAWAFPRQLLVDAMWASGTSGLGPFRTTGAPFSSDAAWLARWGYHARLVPRTMVRFDCLVDIPTYQGTYPPLCGIDYPM